MSVQILMSTYNGEKYLNQQLDSLLAQDYQDLLILIRDDGSADNTINILREYEKKTSKISWYQGVNIGPAQSFFDLIMHADQNTEVFMFADQDDIWLNTKVSRAYSILTKACLFDGPKQDCPYTTGDLLVSNIGNNMHFSSRMPLLYCGETMVVDENLQIIQHSIIRKVRCLSFGNALVQNICTGCTAAINRELLFILQRTIPDYMIMHDWWLYLTASCFGMVIYDKQPYIKYRQHVHNVTGAMISHKDLFHYRIKQLLKKRGEIYLQAEAFKNANSDIPEKI